MNKNFFLPAFMISSHLVFLSGNVGSGEEKQQKVKKKVIWWLL